MSIITFVIKNLKIYKKKKKTSQKSFCIIHMHVVQSKFQNLPVPTETAASRLMTNLYVNKILPRVFHTLLLDLGCSESQSQTPRGFILKIGIRKTNTNKKHRNERKHCPKRKQQTKTHQKKQRAHTGPGSRPLKANVPITPH